LYSRKPCHSKTHDIARVIPQRKIAGRTTTGAGHDRRELHENGPRPGETGSALGLAQPPRGGGDRQGRAHHRERVPPAPRGKSRRDRRHRERDGAGPRCNGLRHPGTLHPPRQNPALHRAAGAGKAGPRRHRDDRPQSACLGAGARNAEAARDRDPLRRPRRAVPGDQRGLLQVHPDPGPLCHAQIRPVHRRQDRDLHRALPVDQLRALAGLRPPPAKPARRHPRGLGHDRQGRPGTHLPPRQGPGPPARRRGLEVGDRSPGPRVSGAAAGKDPGVHDRRA